MTSHGFCPYCMNPVTPGQPCKACGLTAGSYTPLPHHLPPGTVLKERYLIGRVLGEGGFGITYIGCDLQLEVKLAIKEYFPVNKVSRSAASDLTVSRYAGTTSDQFDRDLDRFLKEARTMAKLSKQQTIVTVHDFFRDNNTAYIVMEYIDGTTFKDLAAQRGGRIPAWELLHLIEPLFFALQTMHDAGLIHRDISPENLMLEDGVVRLLDFGCARDLDSDRTMTISLKHSYAPVEQYQGKGQGPWTDVYALGATIYYCLTGIKPPQAMDRLVEDELILPRKLGVDLTESQEKALLHAMRVRPRQRYQSMTEFHTALYEGIEVMPKSPVLMTVGGAAAGAAIGAAAGGTVGAAIGTATGVNTGTAAGTGTTAGAAIGAATGETTGKVPGTAAGTGTTGSAADTTTGTTGAAATGAVAGTAGGTAAVGAAGDGKSGSNAAAGFGSAGIGTAGPAAGTATDAVSGRTGVSAAGMSQSTASGITSGTYGASGASGQTRSTSVQSETTSAQAGTNTAGLQTAGEGGSNAAGEDTSGAEAAAASSSASGSVPDIASEKRNALLIWLKQNKILAGIGAAVIALVLIVGIAMGAASGSGGSNADDTDNTDNTGNTVIADSEDGAEEDTAGDAAAESSTDSTGSSGTYELIGTTAYVLDGTEEALRAALEDDAAESVLVMDNDIDLTGGMLYIEKPLTLEANVWTADSVVVGEGGALVIGGEDADCAFDVFGLLTTRDGGTITVKTGSEISSSGAGYILYLESWDDLVIEDGASLDLLERTNDNGETYHETGGNYSDAFAIDEDALFADAYEADSETALRAAMYDDSVSTVTVTADITLTEEFIQIKPVRIAEGVTVTALSDEQALSEDGETIISIQEAAEGAESVSCVWNISGSVLINHGTLRGSLQTSDPDDTAFSGDEPYLINDGTLTISVDTCRDGTLVNLEDGTFHCMYGDTGCNIVNLGTYLRSSTVSGCNYYNITDPGFAFFNSGTLQIESTQRQPDEGIAEFNILGGVLCNLSGGSIRIGENGQLSSYGDITNYGSIVLTDSSACFLNHRYLALAAGSTLDVRTGQFDNNGIIQSAADASYLSNDGASGHWINVLMYDAGWAEDVTEVTSAAELEAALADESVSTIWWYEEITWEGDLNVSGKTLLGDGLLTITGGDLILSGSDTAAELEGVNVSGGDILLFDDATMLLHEYDGGAQEVGTLEVTGGALLMTTGDTYLADMKIIIEGEGSKVLHNYGVELENCTVEVGNGGCLLGVASHSEDDTSTITISSGGSLVFELGGASIACTIVSEGTIEMYRNVTIASGGSLTSYGELYVGSACELTVQGTLDNQGSITVEGQITAEDGGTVSGYEGTSEE